MTIRRPLRAFFLLVAAFCMVGVPGEAWSQSAGAPASQPPAARGGATPRPAEPVKLPGRLIGAGVREIGWDDLMPEDWDPLKLLEGRGLDAISDGDPRSEALMREIREQWDQAPTRGELEGLRIRIPGYVVPLDMLGGDIREFLLVPYMGACIHTPPPPANQIIQVVSARRQALQTMDAVWVVGTLKVGRNDTRMGVSGYVLDATRIEPYRGPSR
ncbi:MAG: DUF3299 domain-containing protein [Burkholderiaceae bacterium]|jgi:hypothetical protein